MTRIPVPAETLRRLVEVSVPKARIERSNGRNYNARSIQSSASNVLRAVDLADGELVSVDEDDLRTLKVRSYDSDRDASDVRENVEAFIENQHTFNPPK